MICNKETSGNDAALASTGWLGITKRELFAVLVLHSLVSKYTMNNPADQITVTQLSVEIADELVNQLNLHP